MCVCSMPSRGLLPLAEVLHSSCTSSHIVIHAWRSFLSKQIFIGVASFIKLHNCTHGDQFFQVANNIVAIKLFVSFFVCVFVSVFLCVFLSVFLCFCVSSFVSLVVASFRVFLSLCVFRCFFVWLFLCLFVCVFVCVFDCQYTVEHVSNLSSQIATLDGLRFGHEN
jgi:hypothetical protein